MQSIDLILAGGVVLRPVCFESHWSRDESPEEKEGRGVMIGKARAGNSICIPKAIRTCVSVACLQRITTNRSMSAGACSQQSTLPQWAGADRWTPDQMPMKAACFECAPKKVYY